MSSLKLPSLFDQLAQPLVYAESLLTRFSTLAASSNSRALQQQLVAAAADLSALRAQFGLPGAARLQYLDDEGDWTELDSDVALVGLASAPRHPFAKPF